jgi:hypothetical protein
MRSFHPDSRGLCVAGIAVVVCGCSSICDDEIRPRHRANPFRFGQRPRLLMHCRTKVVALGTPPREKGREVHINRPFRCGMSAHAVPQCPGSRLRPVHFHGVYSLNAGANAFGDDRLSSSAKGPRNRPCSAAVRPMLCKWKPRGGETARCRGDLLQDGYSRILSSEVTLARTVICVKYDTYTKQPWLIRT